MINTSFKGLSLMNHNDQENEPPSIEEDGGYAFFWHYIVKHRECLDEYVYHDQKNRINVPIKVLGAPIGNYVITYGESTTTNEMIVWFQPTTNLDSFLSAVIPLMDIGSCLFPLEEDLEAEITKKILEASKGCTNITFLGFSQGGLNALRAKRQLGSNLKKEEKKVRFVGIHVPGPFYNPKLRFLQDDEFILQGAYSGLGSSDILGSIGLPFNKFYTHKARGHNDCNLKQGPEFKPEGQNLSFSEYLVRVIYTLGWLVLQWTVGVCLLCLRGLSGDEKRTPVPS